MQVLRALLTHVGSGICYEVSAALDAMINLASKKSQELIALSSHITGRPTSSFLFIPKANLYEF